MWRNRGPSWNKMDSVYFLGAFLTLIASQFVSATFQALGEDRPLIVPVGEDAILPCRLSRFAELMEVRWFRIRFDDIPMINLFHDGKDQQKCYLPEYIGRTELITKDIDSGKVALKIRNVSVPDEGKYRCYLETVDYFDHADFELHVTALGSAPRIDIEELQDDGIKAVCRSDGWYPEPMLLNKNADGKMAELGYAKKIQNKNGLYKIEYSRVIAENSNRTFSCVLRTSFPNQEREFSVYVADAVFRKTDPSTSVGVSSILITLVIIVLVAALVFAWHRYAKRRRNDAKDNLNSVSVTEEGCKTGNAVQQAPIEDDHERMPLKKYEELQIKEQEQYQDDLEALKSERDSVVAENVRLKANAGPEILVELKDCIESSFINLNIVLLKTTFSPVVIQLDSETANPNLHLSEDRKSMQCRDAKEQGQDRYMKYLQSFELQTAGPQIESDYPPTVQQPRAFDTTLCVLGSQGFTQGRHYWEVEVQTQGSKGWAVGIAQESVRRVGAVFPRPRDGIWAVGEVVSECTAFGDTIMSLKLDTAPRKIRVYLNFEGQVDFYNADNMCHIFTFMPSLKEKVFPFFLIRDSQTSISLC